MTFIKFSTPKGTMVGETFGTFHSTGDYGVSAQEFFDVKGCDGNRYTPGTQNVEPITWEEHEEYAELMGY